jgi:hypothetical protein
MYEKVLVWMVATLVVLVALTVYWFRRPLVRRIALRSEARAAEEVGDDDRAQKMQNVLNTLPATVAPVLRNSVDNEKADRIDNLERLIT